MARIGRWFGRVFTALVIAGLAGLGAYFFQLFLNRPIVEITSKPELVAKEFEYESNTEFYVKVHDKGETGLFDCHVIPSIYLGNGALSEDDLTIGKIDPHQYRVINLGSPPLSKEPSGCIYHMSIETKCKYVGAFHFERQFHDLRENDIIIHRSGTPAIKYVSDPKDPTRLRPSCDGPY